MLEIRSLSAGYGTLTALDAVSARLEPGSRLGVFGHNGAGKTTLLRCIVGAHAGTSGGATSGEVMSGEVVFDGEPVRPGNVPATIRRGIAFVPQGHNVFPNLTVADNLATAGLLFDGKFAGEVLKIFPLLEERRGQRAGSLSGGEQQMLALGMALMTQPKWLLLDEPSTGLAPVIVRDVMSQLAKVNAAFGTGLIIVEQNVPATLKIVEHGLILKSGRTVFSGQAATLAAKPDLWEWF